MASQHGLSEAALQARLRRNWLATGRPSQFAPPGNWRYLFWRCGRGFGKTLSAAQWTKSKALEHGGCRIALIAPTFADGRDTMVEGQTGMLSILENAMLLGQSRDHAWNRSHGELMLANGTLLKIFSSERPDRLRGPQHHFDWREEVSSWNDANKLPSDTDCTWSNANLGTRLGSFPQSVITSTPKPNKLTKGILAIPSPRLIVVTGSSYENQDNLSEAWWDEVVAPLEGTRTGRQEIEGIVLEDVEGALWSREIIEQVRIKKEDVPPLNRIVVAVDPNTTSGETADDAGIIVVGRANRIGYVLADYTTTKGGPRAWAQASVEAYYDWEADRIVAEKNQGGEMVGLTIHMVEPNVPVKLVTASRGKRPRAEPVATLFEGGEDEDGNLRARARIAGTFPELEDELCEWAGESDSPNRLDAMVWGFSELSLQRKEPKGMRSELPSGRIDSGRVTGFESDFGFG